MKKPLLAAALGASLIAGAGLLILSMVGFADWHERHRGQPDRSPSVGRESTLRVDPAYATECGSCHMAYQPQLLPARSWERIMDTLGDHFGDNAELPTTVAAALRAYLAANAGDRSRSSGARGFATSVGPDRVPVRITETPYFRREHHEIPTYMVQNNRQVLSFANCQACHGDAEKGAYDEDRVAIPGYRHWDD